MDNSVYFNKYTLFKAVCFLNKFLLNFYSVKILRKYFYFAGDEPRRQEGEPPSIQVPCQILS